MSCGGVEEGYVRIVGRGMMGSAEAMAGGAASVVAIMFVVVFVESF